MPAAIFKPVFFESPVRNSGSMGATGQTMYTQGGGQMSPHNVSGIGVDTLVVSGPGRLDTMLLTNFLQSGRGVVFYDAAVATSGGPFAASGHRILGVIPPATNTGLQASGIPGGAVAWDGIPKPCGSPFHSGVVAAPWPAGATASGTHGYAISYTLAQLVSGGSAIQSVPAGGMY